MSFALMTALHQMIRLAASSKSLSSKLTPPWASLQIGERVGLFSSTHNEDPPDGDWFLAGGIRLPFSPINWGPRTRRIRAIRVESELRLTVLESQSQGFGASLDVREGSMLPTTLLPGA